MVGARPAQSECGCWVVGTGFVHSARWHITAADVDAGAVHGGRHHDLSWSGKLSCGNYFYANEVLVLRREV